MKLHRFYVNDLELVHDFWLQDENLFHQLTRVLRFQVDRELVLFNSEKEERLYKIVKIGNDAIHLELVTELEPKLPKKDVYLCFSLLKKDKNDWVLQKGTELGVRHFIPIIAARCERSDLSQKRIERWQKIVIEAAEQCGRADIPRIREPISPERIIEELDDKCELFVAEKGSANELQNMKQETGKDSIGILIGPEGGWTDSEKEMFKQNDINNIALSEFTLRAETAAITAVALLAKNL